MKILRKYETHPMTWRLRNDQQPVWIKEYIGKQGYYGAKKAISNITPSDLIQFVIDSGLKGRGGAGFLTGVKWKLMNNNCDTQKKRYLICNADEMEPGTYKDRLLMEQMPHQLIEGMIINAYAIQAYRGYIFLRGEYIDAAINLKKSIKEAYDKKMLGKNIFNSNFSFDIFLHTGAGRYICGEETALINSLEGKRANPRFKPPFPAISGLWGKPTCINNVETISNLPALIIHGIEWYKNLSKGIDSGTKMMGFSGKVNNPGVWELPFGTTAREILEQYAGGMVKNFQLKAWMPGGASTSLLTEKYLDIPMDFSNFINIGKRLGTAIATAIDNKVNIISLIKNIEIFFSRESCGLCTPCREGLPWIVNILNDLEKGKGHKDDLKLLQELCLNLSIGKTFCAHAPGAIEPLSSAMKYFYTEFESGLIS